MAALPDDEVALAYEPADGKAAAVGAVDEAAPALDSQVVELQQFAHAIDAALRAEEISSEEPESEEARGRHASVLPDESTANDSAVAEAVLKRLRSGLVPRGELAQVLEAAGGAAAPALKQLPSLLQELVGLLEKSWQLALLRGERRREISQHLAGLRLEAETERERASRAEVACATAEADAGHGEKAHEMLEGTLARLTAARKTVKEREWELKTAKTRIETLEEDRARQDARLRALETALERSASTRIEASSQAASTLADAEASLANAEASREELQRRLAVAELAADEARALGERRAQDVEGRLAASQSRAEELERRLRELSEAPAPRAPEAAEERRNSGGGEADGELADAADDADKGDGRSSPPAAPAAAAAAAAAAPTSPAGRPPAATGVRAVGGLGGLSSLREQEQHVEGVGILAPTPRTGLRNSLSTRGGVGSGGGGGGGGGGGAATAAARPADGRRGPSPASISAAGGGAEASSRLTSPARLTAGSDRRGQQSTPARAGRRSVSGASGAQQDAGQAPPSMPMDLRALGKLLTGGGLVGKKDGKK